MIVTGLGPAKNIELGDANLNGKQVKIRSRLLHYSANAENWTQSVVRVCGVEPTIFKIFFGLTFENISSASMRTNMVKTHFIGTSELVHRINSSLFLSELCYLLILNLGKST